MMRMKETDAQLIERLRRDLRMKVCGEKNQRDVAKLCDRLEAVEAERNALAAEVQALRAAAQRFENQLRDQNRAVQIGGLHTWEVETEDAHEALRKLLASPSAADAWLREHDAAVAKRARDAERERCNQRDRKTAG